MTTGSSARAVPSEPLGRLFLRFLKFGLLAWGGPVAQIGMIRQELVEEEKWISREHFNRVLGIYQVLPGPEAHELCVYFGMLARGRIGGFLAGLAFMLPGFMLMFLLSVLYIQGTRSALFRALFLGIQPAVVALIVRAVHRIGQHGVTNGWLWTTAVIAALAQLVGTNFWVTLPLSGLAYIFLARRQYLPAAVAGVLLLLGVFLFSGIEVTSKGIRLQAPIGGFEQSSPASPTSEGKGVASTPRPSPARLFASGLRAGLLTFGGACTVLPFLQRDAVGRWMTNTQFLDGVALSGTLPAPFIIFSTFVGYLGGGLTGALVLTVGIFLPAFGFTLLGHRYLEQVVEHAAIRTFLDGVTAGVVGLIGATALGLFRVGVKDQVSLVIFALALSVLYRWKAKVAVAFVVLAAGGIGLLLFR